MQRCSSIAHRLTCQVSQDHPSLLHWLFKEQSTLLEEKVKLLCFQFVSFQQQWPLRQGFLYPTKLRYRLRALFLLIPLLT
jgi:hypothetical protein